MENQYLSDAYERLAKPDLWGPSLETEIQKLAQGENQEIQMKFGPTHQQLALHGSMSSPNVGEA